MKKIYALLCLVLMASLFSCKQNGEGDKFSLKINPSAFFDQIEGNPQTISITLVALNLNNANDIKTINKEISRDTKSETIIIPGLKKNESYRISVAVFSEDELIMFGTQDTEALGAGSSKLNLTVSEDNDNISSMQEFFNAYLIFNGEEEESFIPSKTTSDTYVYIKGFPPALNPEKPDQLTISVTDPDGKTNNPDTTYESSMETPYLHFDYDFNSWGEYSIKIKMTEPYFGFSREVIKKISVGSQTAFYTKNTTDGSISACFRNSIENAANSPSKTKITDYTFTEKGLAYVLTPDNHIKKTMSELKDFDNTDIDVNSEYFSTANPDRQIYYDMTKHNLYVCGADYSDNKSPRIIKIDTTKTNISENTEHTVFSYYVSYNKGFKFAADDDNFYILFIGENNKYLLVNYYPENGRYDLARGFCFEGEIKTNPADNNSSVETTINDFVVYRDKIYILYSHNDTSYSVTTPYRNYGGMIIHDALDINAKPVSFANYPTNRKIPKYANPSSGTYAGQKLTLYHFSETPDSSMEPSSQYVWKDDCSLIFNNENSPYLMNPKRVIGMGGDILLLSDCGLYYECDDEGLNWQYYDYSRIAAFDIKNISLKNKGNYIEYDFNEPIPETNIANLSTSSYATNKGNCYIYDENSEKKWINIGYNDGGETIGVGLNFWDITKRE